MFYRMFYWCSTQISLEKSQCGWHHTQLVFHIRRKRNGRVRDHIDGAISWMLLWNGWRLLRTPLGSHGEKGKEG